MKSVEARKQARTVFALSFKGEVGFDWQGSCYREPHKSSVPQWLRDEIGEGYFRTVTKIMGWRKPVDVSVVQRFDKLEHLSFDNCQIENVSPIADMRSLKVLHLPRNRISDLSPLSHLTQLEELYLIENRVKDITPLENLKHLRVLDLTSNRISDISVLSELPQLEVVWINGNPVQNLAPLKKMSQLKIVNGLSDEALSDLSRSIPRINNNGIEITLKLYGK